MAPGGGMSASVRMLKPEQSGDAVRLRREKLNLSQEELARAAGTTQQTVHRIEVGETRWSRTLPCILDVLGKIERDKTAPQSPGTLVVPAQHEVEVYKNSAGAVVLRMDAGGAYDEDQVVVIRPEHVDAVVAAMVRVKAEVMA